MVTPSKSFTVIPDSDIDPDSPITTGLMTALRDNDVHIEEWLGDGFVAAKNHNHDGINSKNIALTFDQTIVASAGFSGTGFTTIATVTVASADLPSNRDALIICSLQVTHTAAQFPEFRLVADGTPLSQLITPNITAANEVKALTLSEIVQLTTGASRDIILEARVGSSGSATAEEIVLKSVLIT